MNILVSACVWIVLALGVTIAIVIFIHSVRATQFVERHWVVPLLAFAGIASIVVFYWRNPGRSGFAVGLVTGLILAYWFSHRFGVVFDRSVNVIRWTTRIAGFFLSFWAMVRIMPVLVQNTPAIFSLGVFYGFTIVLGGVLLFSGGESKIDQPRLPTLFVTGMWVFIGSLAFLYIALAYIDRRIDVALLLAILIIEHVARTQFAKKDSGSSQGGTPTGGV